MKILKFGAIWCKECLIMKPIWEEIESKMPEIKIEYYDADENSDKIKEFEIDNIPAAVFLDKNNNEILRLEGAVNKEKLERIIREKIDE